MTARILQGIEVANVVRDRIARTVAQRVAEGRRPPGLTTILVGDDPASQSYVAGKNRTAKELGFLSIQHTLPGDVSQRDLLDLIRDCNENDDIDGILVQLPLPSHLDEHAVIDAIAPDKDVDGLHPANLGLLFAGRPRFAPCTPAGIHCMLTYAGVPLNGAEVVVVGRSNLVGKPIAALLMQNSPDANATVTVCHSRTVDIARHTLRADVLIVAMGRASHIRGEMIKPGAAVIDVGVNRVGVKPDGKALLKGDVVFEEAVEVASLITPVPGGVGPMTITMLMDNTLKAAIAHQG